MATNGAGAVLAQESVDKITLDARDGGAVISPMLFGHNLEVTRRAVWRGLGAEMVANRELMSQLLKKAS